MSEPWSIPDSWAWTVTREVAAVVGGGTPRTSDADNFEGGAIPWITPADLSAYVGKYISHGNRNITKLGLKRSAARLLPKGTVLFSSRAPIGYVVIAANPVCTNQGFKSFVLPDGIDPEFVYYYLRRARELALALASGTTFQELSGSQAAKVPFVLAPQPEQRRIVAAIESYFTRLDDAAASLERVQRNLKRYRASVLKAAVEGRLVPTEAELARAEGRSYEPASVLLERILAERRKLREKSGRKGKYHEPIGPDNCDLPGLPEGWCWATVEQLSTKVVDGVHKKPEYVVSGVPFVTVKNLTAGPGISLERLRYITPEDHRDFIRRANPEWGDLLISKDGTLGVVRAIKTKLPFSIFVSVAMIKPVVYRMTDYLELALSSPLVQSQMVPKGSGLQHIHLEDLRRDCIPLPPPGEQGRIVVEAQRRLSLIDELEASVGSIAGRLIRLRQSILKWAFEGKLVDQDPNDEPASVLLERIRDERPAVVPLTNSRIRRTSRRAIR